MKKLIFSAIGILLYLSATAQMPERTPENIQKYKEICRKYIYKDMKGMYREAGGALKYYSKTARTKTAGRHSDMNKVVCSTH